jgi:hypothetical protein
MSVNVAYTTPTSVLGAFLAHTENRATNALVLYIVTEQVNTNQFTSSHISYLCEVSAVMTI